MPIKVNDSSTPVLGSLWSGIANMQVVILNPSMEQMKVMGMNPQKEPEYVTNKEKDGASWKSLRLDFYVINAAHKIKTKVTLWLEDKERTNKDGNKFQYIDKFGNVAWPKGSDTEPNYTWFDKASMRKAYIGEDPLMNFVKAWANADPKAENTLDIAKMFKGDLSELSGLVKLIEKNEVQCLLGVRDGKYQDVYTKHFDRPYRKNFDTWRKALEGEYGEFKSDYQNDLNLKPYSGNSQVTTDNPSTLGNAPATGGNPYNF